MTVALRKDKKTKAGSCESKADRTARALGGRPFDINERVVDIDFSDAEFDDFMRWREEMRKAELEALKHWQP